MEDGNKKKQPVFSPMNVALDVGFSIAIPIVMLALLGRVLDNRFESSPVFLLSGILLSMIVSTGIILSKMKKFF